MASPELVCECLRHFTPRVNLCVHVLREELLDFELLQCCVRLELEDNKQTLAPDEESAHALTHWPTRCVWLQCDWSNISVISSRLLGCAT